MKFLPFIILIFAIVFFATNNVLSISDSVNVQLQVTGDCNNNNICEENLGEGQLGCPADCGCNNNGQCESGRLETEANCSGDCAVQITTPIGGTDVPDINIYIKNLIVSDITFDSAVISWQTTNPASCVLSWGVTSGYEKEIISETAPSLEHLTKLNNLEIATPYYYKILCKDNLNQKAESEAKNFSTLRALENVSNFKATPGDKEIILSWDNPKDTKFKGVRLVKNTDFFPANFEDGITIYDGTREIFTDENLINDKIYYYTIFVYDKDENYSSGAVVFAAPHAQGGAVIPPEEPQPPVVPPEVPEEITINDFNFYSDGQKLILKNGKIIEVENNKNVIVTIDYKKIPREYNTIIFSFRSEDSIYSYLLKPDKEKNIYFTTFKSPESSGIFPIEIIFFDAANNRVLKLDAELSVFKKEIEKPIEKSIFAGVYLNFKMVLIFLWLILLLLVIIIFLLIRQRRKEEENQKEKNQNVIPPAN